MIVILIDNTYTFFFLIPLSIDHRICEMKKKECEVNSGSVVEG